ncbi:hypothetical protein ACHAXH_000128 [Discostella pseudostelligera]
MSMIAEAKAAKEEAMSVPAEEVAVAADTKAGKEEGLSMPESEVTANGKTQKMSLPISDASSHHSKGGKADAAVDAMEMSMAGTKATKLFKPVDETATSTEEVGFGKAHKFSL